MPKCKKYYNDIDKYREYCKRGRLKYYRKSQGRTNSWARWTSEEIDMVLAHSISDSELAMKLGRSVQSIQLMRYKSKKRHENWTD